VGSLKSAFIWLLHAAHRRAIDARRRGRTGAYVGLAVLSGITVSIGLALGLGMFLGLWAAGLEPIAIMIAVLVIVPFAGPSLVRSVLAPRGWVRLTQYTAYGSIAAGKDPSGYALVASAWAHLRRPSPGGEKWIDRQRGLRGMCGDAEVVTAGLIALARGDVAAGRQLLLSAAELRERHAAVRELAAECLAAIDVEAGSFTEILARAGNPDAWPASPLTFLIEGCAQRIVGDPHAPTAGALWARWALAPRRFATRALVSRALAAAPSPRARRKAPPAPAPISERPALAPWPAAVIAHVAALRARKPDRAVLAGAAHAWDAALTDPDTRMWLYQRAAELAAPVDDPTRGFAPRPAGEAGRVPTPHRLTPFVELGETAARELRAQVASDLAELAEHAQIATVDDGSAIAAEIARQARGQRLATLELAFAAWEDRARARAELPAVDEWRAFLSLRASYDHAVAAGGLELRRLAFPHALTAGTVASAWLWNQRKEYVLSHAISCWLLAEARAVGDASAIENEAHNCRLEVPIRSD
jgi:hypothetical protein